MVNAPLAPLTSALTGLIAHLDGKARRALARDIAKQLRTRQQQRIQSQQNPDGSAFSARKPQLRQQKGRVRRQMFSKLRQAKWLRTEATPNGAAVAFAAQVERLARVHQFGLRDRVSRKSTVEAQYPARELLGFSPDDIEAIKGQFIEHLGRK